MDDEVSNISLIWQCGCLNEENWYERSQFLPNNKVDEFEQLKRYNMGVFDFQTSYYFLLPMATLVILNMASFTVGDF
ncbi:unnamed protein product [Prunus armeniaca]|uniref:Uncharacterized protein n=1 Tax=Prunus armeniaca TaxID=36596 RepID=A0A6J5UNG5_PRUAR|nr:unnamed protein product [Prunus armeniaca]